MNKNVRSIIQALIKINRFLNRVENFSKQKYVIVTLKVITSIVLLSVAVCLARFFGSMVFVEDDNFGMIPHHGMYNLNALLALLLIFWFFQLSILLVKSVVFLTLNQIVRVWKWKGYWHTWNQIAVIPFLTIFVVAMFFAMGISIGSLTSSQSNISSRYLGDAYLIMSENESVIYFTAKLSAIVFVIMIGATRIKREVFSKLNRWRATER